MSDTEMLTLLETIESWIDDETDRKIRGQRPNWAMVCCKIWHEIGTPLSQLRESARTSPPSSADAANRPASR